MGTLYLEYLKDFVDAILIEQDKIGLKKIIQMKLDNSPINDIGKSRMVSWKAFGSCWNIEFQNDFRQNSIGEEFAALIQIIQTDIALRGVNFQFCLTTIKIQIELVETLKNPEKLPSKSEHQWKVYVPLLTSKIPTDKNIHYAALTSSIKMILRELSDLSEDNFQTKFYSLLENGLGNRALIINAYQKSYRKIYSEEKFNSSMRNKFDPELLIINQYESATLAARKD